MVRFVRSIAAAFTIFILAAAPSSARDDPPANRADNSSDTEGVSTADLFGFTQGSDVADPGERGAAVELEGFFGRRPAPFIAGTSKFEVNFGVLDGLEIAPSLTLGATRLRDPDTLAVRGAGGVVGFGTEVKVRLLERAPLGITLLAEPQFGWFDEGAGARGERRALETKLLIDAVVLPEQVFAALNIIYDLDWFRRRGREEIALGVFAPYDPERASTLGFSAAIAGQAAENLFLGGEARYLRAYEGLALSKFEGNALFLGPTLYWKASDAIEISAGWSAQVWGRAAGRKHGLDLHNFNRHQAKLKVSIALP
jgi:hypothetical protein